MIRKLILIRIMSMFSFSGAKKKGIFGKMGMSSGSGANNVGMIILMFLYPFLGIYFAAMSFSLSSVLVGAVRSANEEWLYFVIFNVLTFVSITFLSVFETKNVLFDCKDNELLLSMPIRPSDILISRISTVVIFNYLISAVIMLPAVIVFFISGGGAVTLIGSLLVFMILPMLATAISCIAGYAFAIISKKFKNNSIVGTVMTLLFLVLYFVIYGAAMDKITQLEESPDAFVASIASALGSLKFTGEISLLKPIPFIVFALLSILIIFLVFFVISKNYINIITKSVKTNKVKYVSREMNSSSVFVAIAKKEITRFVSSTTYMINGGIGSIMQIGVAVLLLVKSGDLGSLDAIFSEMGMASLSGALPILFVAASLATSATNFTSASALSLEGDNLWIIATAPIRLHDIVLAKLVPQLMVSLPASLISSILIAIALGIGIFETAFIIVIPLLAALLFAITGLILNIAMPKFDFVNEAQVIKQSGASGITMLVNILIALVLFGVGVLSSLLLGNLFALSVLTFVLTIMIVIMSLILLGPSSKRLQKIFLEN